MTAHGVPEFRLRFPPSEITSWADRYAYADDSELVAIGETAGSRGWYTRDEFLTVARWKSPRSKSRCETNDAASVEEVTRLALSTADERLAIKALTRLYGVQFPTASVLLHLAHGDRYPIIDYRALWSLSVEAPAYYSFGFWWAYTQACRSLADEARVSMRTLDRALWQYSKRWQEADGSGLVEQAADARRMPGQDRLRAIALGVVTQLPVIGPVLAEVLANEVPAARECRLRDLLEHLAADVERLREDLDAHLTDDTFTETVETAIEEAMRASESAKREAYAAIVANSLTSARPNEEERLFFLDVAGRSRTLHLRVLRVASETTAAPEGFFAGAPSRVLLPKLPGYDADLVRLAWNDLASWAMVNTDWSAMNATMTREGAGNLAARLSDLGRRFLRFVSVPGR